MNLTLKSLKFVYTNVAATKVWGACGPVNAPTVSYTVTDPETKSTWTGTMPKAQMDMIELLKDLDHRLIPAELERIIEAANGMADHARAEANADNERH